MLEEIGIMNKNLGKNKHNVNKTYYWNLQIVNKIDKFLIKK